MIEEVLPEVFEFDWDEGNIDKNKKHGVENSQAEQVLLDKKLIIIEDEKHSNLTEIRYLALGISKTKRKLSVIFTNRENRIRVISARAMSKKERRLYEKKVFKKNPKI